MVDSSEGIKNIARKYDRLDNITAKICQAGIAGIFCGILTMSSSFYSETKPNPLETRPIVSRHKPWRYTSTGKRVISGIGLAVGLAGTLAFYGGLIYLSSNRDRKSKEMDRFIYGE